MKTMASPPLTLKPSAGSVAQIVVLTVTVASGFVQTGGVPVAGTPNAKAVTGLATQSGSMSLAIQAGGTVSPAKSSG